MESLVGWVKSNFVPERSFIDDADLVAQNGKWADRANQTVSQAHFELPWDVLQQEEAQHLNALSVNPENYPILDIVTPRGSAYVRLHNLAVGQKLNNFGAAANFLFKSNIHSNKASMKASCD